MEVMRQTDAIFVDKKNGTFVHYYNFPEYEIHYNEVLPRTVQQWHHHETIEEVIYIISGRLNAYWSDNERVNSAELSGGDAIRVKNMSHTFANLSSDTVKFMVFRMIPRGFDARDAIKADKIVDVPPSCWNEAALLNMMI